MAATDVCYNDTFENCTLNSVCSYSNTTGYLDHLDWLMFELNSYYENHDGDAPTQLVMALDNLKRNVAYYTASCLTTTTTTTTIALPDEVFGYLVHNGYCRDENGVALAFESHSNLAKAADCASRCTDSHHCDAFDFVPADKKCALYGPEDHIGEGFDPDVKYNGTACYVHNYRPRCPSLVWHGAGTSGATGGYFECSDIDDAEIVAFKNQICAASIKDDQIPDLPTTQDIDNLGFTGGQN